MYLRAIIFFLSLSFITGFAVVMYNFGYQRGYTKCSYTYIESAKALINRSKQNEIHEVLGKYQGLYTDNESYDADRLNRLFDQDFER